MSQDVLGQDMDKWLAALDAIVTRVQTFYKDGQHDKGF